MKTIQASLLTLLLLAGSVAAQSPSVFVLDMGNGKLAAMVKLADGQMVVVSKVTILRIPPPSPPVPLTVRAYLLRETGEGGQQQADLEAQIRLKPSLSAKLKFLDPDQAEHSEQVKLMVEAVGDNLPRLVAVGSDGSVVDSKPQPESIEGIEAILKGWGL